jgi:hypothetical protein
MKKNILNLFVVFTMAAMAGLVFVATTIADEAHSEMLDVKERAANIDWRCDLCPQKAYQIDVERLEERCKDHTFVSLTN